MTTAKLKQPKLPVPIATDIALHVATKDGHAVPLSYWDVWYALLTQDQFGGDLEQLAQALRAMSKGCPSSEDAKRKLSHLRDFQQRLTSSEVSLAEVVAAISPELAKTEAQEHADVCRHPRSCRRQAPAGREVMISRKASEVIGSHGSRNWYDSPPAYVSAGEVISVPGGGMTSGVLCLLSIVIMFSWMLKPLSKES
jgi:hypothetical protein